jgi:hypothetical protein
VILLQEALAKRDIEKARIEAKLARSAFEQAEFADGLAMVAVLEEQSNTMEGLEGVLIAAVHGSDDLQGARSALAAGRLEEAREKVTQARSKLATDGLATLSWKGLENLTEIENDLEAAEKKAGTVREGLKVSGRLYYV